MTSAKWSFSSHATENLLHKVFLQRALPSHACIFTQLSDLLHPQVTCIQHGKLCEPLRLHPHLVCAGPPCAPYSAQRPARYSEGSSTKGQTSRICPEDLLSVGNVVLITLKDLFSDVSAFTAFGGARELGGRGRSAGRWQSHGEAHTLFAVINYLAHARPMGGVVENVMGFSFAPQGEMCALQVLQQRLSALGYTSEAVAMDLGSLHAVRRARIGD